MLTKLLLVFSIGVLENFLYTWYLLEVGRKKVIKSSILDILYMLIYLGIVSWAIKDTNTLPLLCTYALSCGAGNYLQMKWDLAKDKQRVKEANKKVAQVHFVKPVKDEEGIIGI